MTQDVTTPVQIEAGRECGCPEWVMQCAHFEGQMISLHPRLDANYGQYVLCHSSSPFVASSGEGWMGVQHENNGGYQGSLSYEEAREAFRAAEERLLRGEPS